MTERPEAIRTVISELRDDYASALPGRVAQIEQLWRRLVAEEAPPAELEELIRMAHGIAGSGATFGFAQASHAARELEYSLEPYQAAGALPAAAEREGVAGLIATLKQAAA
jgi:HPt (histidine-containing phosphotransfer) domain-containing protein